MKIVSHSCLSSIYTIFQAYSSILSLEHICLLSVFFFIVQIIDILKFVNSIKKQRKMWHEAIKAKSSMTFMLSNGCIEKNNLLNGVLTLVHDNFKMVYHSYRNLFLCPRLEWLGHLVFVMSVCFTICLFVCLSVVNFNLCYIF